MQPHEIVERARMALVDAGVKVSVLPVCDRRPHGGLELSVPPGNLFVHEEKIDVIGEDKLGKILMKEREELT